MRYSRNLLQHGCSSLRTWVATSASQQAADKQQVIEAIPESEDFKQFLKESKLAERL